MQLQRAEQSLIFRGQERESAIQYKDSTFLPIKTVEVQCRLPQKMASLPSLELVEMILWHLPSELFKLSKTSVINLS